MWSSERRLVLQQLLEADQVFVVLDTFVFTKPLVRTKPERFVLVPWRREHFRVLHRDVIADRVVRVAAKSRPKARADTTFIG